MRRFVEGADRGRSTLFPECLEDWIGEDNPVRVIDVFVEELDLADLGFGGVDPEATGRARQRGHGRGDTGICQQPNVRFWGVKLTRQGRHFFERNMLRHRGSSSGAGTPHHPGRWPANGDAG